jgi:hypothetical protein
VQFEAKPTTRFKTEIPGVREQRRALGLLEQKGVVVNAQPLDTGPPVVAEPAARLRADDPVRLSCSSG